MVDGPPSSAAGPSSSSLPKDQVNTPATGTSASPLPPVVTNYNPYSTAFTFQQPYYNYTSYAQNSSTKYGYVASTAAPNWTGDTYAHSTASGTPKPHTPHNHYGSQAASQVIKLEVPTNLPSKNEAKSPSPSPSPSEVHRHWDSAIRSFLDQMGLTQALRGFDLDMLVLNSDFERSTAPRAVDKLIKDLISLRNDESTSSPTNSETKYQLEERKIDYARLAFGEKARSQTSVIKDVSALLAQNRARSDASNRAEFLHSIKKRRVDGFGGETEEDPRSTCARTDAKHLDRDLQMKYDVARNEDGPLRRTMKEQLESSAKQSNDSIRNTETSGSEDKALAETRFLDSENHPGLDERLKNIEAHFAVRYVPSMPRDLLSRLKSLEDHIVRLEKDYPPWAALHFNQPNRGWPPPPRSTPIIVPAHLRKADQELQAANPSAITTPDRSPDTPPTTKVRNNKSSLHRAVLERLEVQQAMNEMNTMP